MNHSLLVRIRMLKWADFLAILKMLISLPIVFFKALTEKEIWLICESESEARDNGYWLFKYICEEHKEINVIYAIDYKASDYKKVKNLGRTCRYGSVMHWVYYFLAKYNVSTQKGGKPNAAICYVLEVYNIIKNTRIFLQHGITYNDAEWLYYENTKMRLFVCGAKKEYEYVKEYFGYPTENVKYLGFARFDNLLNMKKTNICRRILVMPTWREWLVLNTQMSKDIKYDGEFKNTLYYKSWNALLNSDKLLELLEKYNIQLFFYPHRNMQPYLESFEVKSNHVEIASSKMYDIQELLVNSDLLITDYSSVFFDYAYLKKPVLFYQFDSEEFRKGQYKEGYFKFDEQKLGIVCDDIDVLVNQIKKNIDNNFEITHDAEQYVDNFFTIHDNMNCKRIFEEIKKI